MNIDLITCLQFYFCRYLFFFYMKNWYIFIKYYQNFSFLGQVIHFYAYFS